MRVTFRLFGDVATLAGRPELSVEVAEGADLAGCLTALSRQSGQPVAEALLFDEQTILPSIAVLVNGSNVLLGAGLKTHLKDGDHVAVMPLIGGGS